MKYLLKSLVFVGIFYLTSCATNNIFVEPVEYGFENSETPVLDFIDYVNARNDTNISAGNYRQEMNDLEVFFRLQMLRDVKISSITNTHFENEELFNKEFKLNDFTNRNLLVYVFYKTIDYNPETHKFFVKKNAKTTMFYFILSVYPSKYGCIGDYYVMPIVNAELEKYSQTAIDFFLNILNYTDSDFSEDAKKFIKEVRYSRKYRTYRPTSERYEFIAFNPSLATLDVSNISSSTPKMSKSAKLEKD